MRVAIDGLVFDLMQGTYLRDRNDAYYVIQDTGLTPITTAVAEEAREWGHIIWDSQTLLDLREGRTFANNNPFVVGDWRAELRSRILIPDKVEINALPVIGELNEAGQKRLPLTRYKLLEKKFTSVVQLHNSMVDQLTDQVEKNKNLRHETDKQSQEIANLKANSTESEVVIKKLNAMTKELKLPVKLGMYKTMEQKLNAFFGALLASCRVNSNEPDEIAE